MDNHAMAIRLLEKIHNRGILISEGLHEEAGILVKSYRENKGRLTESEFMEEVDEQLEIAYQAAEQNKSFFGELFESMNPARLRGENAN